jgi:hypothetical protein
MSTSSNSNNNNNNNNIRSIRSMFLLSSVILQAIIGSCLVSESSAFTMPFPLLSSSTTSTSVSMTTKPSTSTTTTTTTTTTTILKMSGGGGGGGEGDETDVPFATIVGNGRIGDALAKAGNCIVLGRNDKIDPNGDGPIFLATRNDSLELIINECPINRRKDLVFLQNGYLDSFLEKKNLTQNTQILLYLSVASKGLTPTDGVTTYNPEGLTTACGEWATNFQSRLASLNLKCNVVSSTEYKPSMYEKLIWISTYMLVGAANNCSSVGDASKNYSKQIESIINELVTGVSEKEGITFTQGTIDRLKSYTDVVADFPCGVKEFEWRNKYFYDLGDDNVPIHNNLLKECSKKGILSFDLP